jgi:CRISPR-associated protein Cmr6
MMPFYPIHKELKEISLHMQKGNYGLWYNKFIPLSEKYKASNAGGDDNKTVDYYFECYKSMKNGAGELLERKHSNLDGFCESFPGEQYEIISIQATLKSPLITGIGESHPHEVSMVVDHNMGIPYIPASGVKGIVRFAHTLIQIPEAEKQGSIEGNLFNDEEEWTLVPQMFGTQKQRGRIVFLDAYSEKVPELHIDIMNPHYGPYYSDSDKTTPPADFHNPVPLKFLTVAVGTVFIFRVITEKKNDLPLKVKIALIRALTQEGVGAKTAVGYGRFEIGKEKGNGQRSKLEPQKLQERSPREKWCDSIKGFKANEAGKIGPTIDNALKELISEDDKQKFAQFVKIHMGKAFKGSKAKEKLKNYLL